MMKNLTDKFWISVTTKIYFIAMPLSAKFSFTLCVVTEGFNLVHNYEGHLNEVTLETLNLLVCS